MGGKKESCPELKVHGTIIESVEEDTYLGDLISGDGKNKKNIEKRIWKALHRNCTSSERIDVYQWSIIQCRSMVWFN